MCDRKMYLLGLLVKRLISVSNEAARCGLLDSGGGLGFIFRLARGLVENSVYLDQLYVQFLVALVDHTNLQETKVWSAASNMYLQFASWSCN
jgi:hypothetical protein